MAWLQRSGQHDTKYAPIGMAVSPVKILASFYSALEGKDVYNNLNCMYVCMYVCIYVCVHVCALVIIIKITRSIIMSRGVATLVHCTARNCSSGRLVM